MNKENTTHDITDYRREFGYDKQKYFAMLISYSHLPTHLVELAMLASISLDENVVTHNHAPWYIMELFQSPCLPLLSVPRKKGIELGCDVATSSQVQTSEKVRCPWIITL